MRGLLTAWLIGTLLPTVALAQAGKVIELPEGESVRQLEWASATQLTALVETADGLALRRIDIGDCSIAVVPAPRSFAQLEGARELQLAPHGGAVAAIVNSPLRSLQPASLQLYRITNIGLDDVNLRKLDREFFPEQIAWQQDGDALYVSAAPYLGAEQSSSVVAVNVTSGAIESVLERSKADLIEKLVAVSGREGLVLKCGSVNGEFPLEPVIALADLKTGEVTVLHAEGQEFGLTGLADGSVILTAPRSARERWVLPQGTDKLQKIDLNLDLTDWTSSTDRLWLGGLADGLRVRRSAGKRYAVLQSQSGTTIVSSEPSNAVRIAPGALTAAIVSADGSVVTIVDLPAPAASE
jgi:hypothetical protein